MNFRRLVVVARSFWPAANVSEICLSALVSHLVKRGYRIDVLTPRWHRNWNRVYQFVGIDVTRIAKPTNRRWRTEPFSKGLKAWFNEQDQQLDAIVVWDGWHDAELISSISGLGIPVINRLNVGLHGISNENQRIIDQIQHDLVNGRNPGEVCWVCDSTVYGAFARKSSSGHSRVVCIDDQLPFEFTGTKTRTDSRLALSDSHQMLAIGPNQALGVYVGEISADYPILAIIKAWEKVTATFAGAMFWFIGNGNGCEMLWEAMLQHEMQHNMLIVGEFDALEDVLMAANVCVSFERDGLSSSSARLASALRLPVVKIPIGLDANTKGCLEDIKSELIFAIGDPDLPSQPLMHHAAAAAFNNFTTQYECLLESMLQ